MKRLERSLIVLLLAQLLAAEPTFQVAESDLAASPVLIFYGDTRFTNWRFPANATVPWARRAIVQKIASEKPDALFITGDIPFQGAEMSDYKVFQQETQIWRALHLRAYPALGNHEFYARDYWPHHETGLKNWWTVFPALKGLSWYSVQLGSQIYALCLDSNFGALKAGGAQRLWIDRQLASLPQTIHYVFFVLHHAPSGDYLEGHGGHSDPERTATDLDSYFERKQQTMRPRFLVISGHVHNYGRFEHKGVTYLITGGGGAHPVFFRRQPDDQFKGRDLTEEGHALPNFHYVRFELDGNKLNATMIRISNPQSSGAGRKWEVADKFSISPASRN